MRLREINSLLLRMAILVGLSLVIRSGAEACSCIMPGPPCASYWQADAVFSGKVTAISSVVSAPDEDSQSPWPRMRRVTIAIESAFRGVEGRSVQLLTGQGGGDCGYNFVAGERYLVYAHRSNRGLVATICSRTRPLKDASEDLAYIQNLPPAGSGATIKGRVIKQSLPFEPEPERRNATPMADTLVMIAGQGITRQERTNSTGDFQFSGLPGGTYKVRVDIPRTSDDSFTEMEVNVVDRGCSDIPFSVNLNGRIQGRVVGPDSQPISGMKIDVIRASDRKEAAPKAVWRFSHEDGTFAIEWLPPGIYLVGVNLVGSPNASCPFPRTYLPGTRDHSNAHEIQVGENQIVKGLELNLGVAQADRTIEGTVVWPDGKPAWPASINITNGSGMPWVVSTAVTDEAGRFRISAPAGCSFKIHAFTYGGRKSETDAEIIPQRHSEPVVLRTDTNSKTPLRLVLTSPGFQHRDGEQKQ